MAVKLFSSQYIHLIQDKETSLHSCLINYYFMHYKLMFTIDTYY